MHSDWKMIPVYLDRELDQAKAKEAKKEKQRTIRARVAQADNKTRELATSVKLRLPKDHLCPYCGNDLGDDTHADHIYPVSRGGLSTLVNMVYVCATCNIRKRDNTLKMFIDEFGLDRDGIEKRLSKLGKEY
jgi:5-methylcytosine-specific restriction endonuclease McrA